MGRPRRGASAAGRRRQRGLKTFLPSARIGGVDRIAVVKGTRPRFHCSPPPRKIEMADPTEPADTTFQSLLNREILVSERRRMLILAALQALIFVLILLAATFAPGFVRSIYHDRLPERAALAAISAFIAYELFAASLVSLFLRRGRNYPVFARYANAFVETSFPTVLLYLLAGYLSAPAIVFGTWPALLYFLFIILSTLRLDFCTFGLYRRGRRGRTLRPRLSHLASWLACRGPKLQHRLSSDAQRRPSRSRLACRLCRIDDQEPFPARARRRLGPRRSDQPLRSTRLAARGRAAARDRRGRAERNEAGVRHVRRHPQLHRSGAQPNAGRGRRAPRRRF